MTKSSDNNADTKHGETRESRQSLGNLFKKTRESQGKTLEDISKATGIGKSKLEALEENDRRNLPADVFVRGFIRIYAAQLDIDSQHALDRFEGEWRDDYDEEVNEDTSLLQAEVFAKSSLILRRWPALVTTIVLCGIIYMISKYFFPALFVIPTPIQSEKLSNELPKIEIVTDEPSLVEPLQSSASGTQAQTSSSVPPKESLSVEKKAAQNKVQASTSPQDSTTESKPLTIQTEALVEAAGNRSAAASADIAEKIENTANSDVTIPDSGMLSTENTDGISELGIKEKSVPQVLNLLFTERTWVKISIDGQPAKEEIFRQGAEQTWKAEETFDLYLGNAGGVKITLNGEPMPLEQESGQTVRLQIP